MTLWDKIIERFNLLNSVSYTKKNPKLVSFLTEELGIRPNDYYYYERAFVHRSAQIKDEDGNDVNFERLEFLGDAVLGVIVAFYLFEHAPDRQEGYLTKMRSKMVSRQQLNSIGRRMKLKSLLHPDGNPNLGEDIYGNLVEALIGAVYMDKGFEFTKELIFQRILEKNVSLERIERSVSSYKSLILEWGQKTKRKIEFNTFEEDSQEDLTVFISVIRLNDEVISRGKGTSKKKAEENASRRAFYHLESQLKNEI